MLKSKAVEYKDIGHARYQLEVPAAVLSRMKTSLPSDWQIVSQTKTVKRFHTSKITSMLKPLTEAEYTVEVQQLKYIASSLIICY